MNRPFSLLIGILLAPIAAYLLYNGSLLVLGYEFSGTPEKLAQKLIAKGRSAEDCFHFRTMDIGPRPTTYELQMRCVYVYASITKDATACELLMPSSYGMSCIGAAEDSPEINCFLQRDGRLMCNLPGPGINQEYYDIDQLDNCQLYEKYKNPDVILWCAAERANEYGDLEGCLVIAKTEEEMDLCHYKRATNLNDLRSDLCENIFNQSKRLGCAATVNAWQRYPELKPQENWLKLL